MSTDIVIIGLADIINRAYASPFIFSIFENLPGRNFGKNIYGYKRIRRVIFGIDGPLTVQRRGRSDCRSSCGTIVNTRYNQGL